MPNGQFESPTKITQKGHEKKKKIYEMATMWKQNFWFAGKNISFFWGKR